MTTSNASVIELLDFALLEVSLRMSPSRSNKDFDEGTLEIELSPMSVENSPDEMRLLMTVAFESPMREGEPKGLSGKAEIAGHFACPTDITVEKRPYLLLYNGALILYGLLRGQLAAITGSFPTGRFMLPSVNMKQIVDSWLMRQRNLAAGIPEKKLPKSKTPKKPPPPATRRKEKKTRTPKP